MVTTTPKLRGDLHAAEVVDHDEVLYYDVSDPTTGGVLRLFDYEWLIAKQFDGHRGLDEVARWTEGQFGFAASRDDIAVYAERLQQLGLVEGTVAAGAKPLPAALFASAALRAVGALAVPGKAAAAPAPTPAPVQVPAQLPRETAPSKPPQAAPARSLDPVERRPSRDEDALMGQPILATPRQPGLAHPQRLTPAAVAPTPAPTPVAPVVAPPPVESEPPSLPQTPIGRAKSDMLAAIESLPPPVDEPPAKVASTTAPMEQVPPPVAQPEPVLVAANLSPQALLQQAGSPSAATPVREPAATPAVQAPAPTPAQIPIEQEPVARPTEPLKPVEAAVETPPAERPTVPVGDRATAQVQPTAEAGPPVSITPTTQPKTQPEQTGGAGKWIVLLIVLAALAGAAYYFLALRQPPPPPAVGVRVSVAKPEDVARSFPTAAVVKKSEPQPLKIDSEGTVAKVVADETEVQPDTVLVALDTQTKFNKELADLKERLGFYRRKLETAKAKGKQDAQQKIAEKQQRLEEVETIIKKSQLVAPRPGVVSKALVKVGQAVTAGTEVVSFADKALAAEIKIPALEAAGMKVGQDAQLTGPSGAVSARVASLRTEGDYAMVQFSLPETTTAKVGEELKLQKSPLTQVVRLPSSVLVEGSKVFVVRDGKAAAVPVTVADRDGEAVLVQGLPSGEQVIISRPTELHEGTAVRIPTATDP